MLATCSLLAAAMLPGASTIKEEEHFNKEFSAQGIPLEFLDFFTKYVDLVVSFGDTALSALEFKPLGLLSLIIAGCLGDLILGEIGGVVTKGLIFALILLLLLPLVVHEGEISILGDDKGCNAAAEEILVGEFFRELRRSKRGT